MTPHLRGTPIVTQQRAFVSSSNIMDWSALLQPAFQVLAQYLPQQQLHGTVTSCVLVCSSWKEGFASCITSLDVGNCSDGLSLQQWLHNYGSSLSRLHVGAAADYCIAALPCAKLQQLDLSSCCLQLQPRSQLCADLHAAAGLTSLSLAEVTFPTMPDLTAVLAGLPNLLQLSLRRLYLCNISSSSHHGNQNRPFQLPSMLLQDQALPQVTRLELELGLSAELLQQVALATQLQHLSLQDIKSRDVAEALVGLQQLHALTFLQLGQIICNLTPSLLPGLSKLTALHTLQLTGSAHWRCSMQAAVLEGLTQLQHLRLQHMTRFAALPGAGSTGALLALLPAMMRLTCLDLINLDLYGAPVAAYSAITASSALQRLSLRESFCDGSDVGIWQHVLCRPKQRLQLTALVLNSAAPDLPESVCACLAEHCPALQELDVSLSLQSSAGLFAFTQLSGLVRLATSNGFDQDMLQAVTQTSRLRDLSVHSYTVVTHAELLQLTVLRGLTSLTLHDERSMISTELRRALHGGGFGLKDGHATGAQHAEAAAVSTFQVRNKALQGFPSDVWQQLKQVCGTVSADAA